MDEISVLVIKRFTWNAVRVEEVDLPLPSPTEDLRGTGNVGEIVLVVESVVSAAGGDRIDPNVEAVKFANCRLKPDGIIRPTAYRPAWCISSLISIPTNSKGLTSVVSAGRVLFFNLTL